MLTSDAHTVVKARVEIGNDVLAALRTDKKRASGQDMQAVVLVTLCSCEDHVGA